MEQTKLSDKAKERIENFIASFQSVIDEISRSKQPDQLLEILVQRAESLGKLFQDFGNKTYRNILKNEKAEDALSPDKLLLHHIINYAGSEYLKTFMILWRDSIFQLQKAQLYTFDKYSGENLQQQLLNDILLVFGGAANELTEELLKQVDKAEKSPETYKKQLKEWLLQKNPWPVYSIQLNELVQQCQKLNEKQQVILETANGFQDIEARIFGAIRFCHKELDEVIGFIRQATEFIELEAQAPSEKNLSRIANKLQAIETMVSITFHIDQFNAQLEQGLDQIAGETEFTIQIQNGLLVQTRINFVKRLSLWLNREILPLLFEVWEITELNKNGLKMALQNIRNMAILYNSETGEKKQIFNSHTFLHPLNVLVENNKEAIRQLNEFDKIISQRIEAEMKLSLIYEANRYFLPFSSGTTMTNRLNLGRSKLIKVSQSWIKGQILQLHRLRKKVVHEFSLSRAEKMVRYLQFRQRDESNAHYTSFFTTKGYFGDLFSVGRDEELAHLSLLINNWRNGYRGSAIITGQRFSGKTLLGELVASRNFPDDTIRLSPGITLNLQGRKMEATYEISESLEFIAKNFQVGKCLIWIDDFELWWEPNVPLYRNLMDLANFIDHNSGRFFFMVSMNLSTFHHLKQVAELERIFQAHIHLSKLSSGEIEQAIMVRHLATHRTLLNEKGEKVGQAEFRRIAKELAQLSKGVVGDALNLWSFLIKRVDDETVQVSELPSFGMPEFYKPDLAVLLTSMMLQKRTNEYRLRKLFGPAFGEWYRPLLMRLISIRVIERQLDGWLEINERIVNELGLMLDDKHYLNY